MLKIQCTSCGTEIELTHEDDIACWPYDFELECECGDEDADWIEVPAAK